MAQVKDIGVRNISVFYFLSGNIINADVFYFSDGVDIKLIFHQVWK